MKSPMNSSLICLISQAIDNCFYNGDGYVGDGNGLTVYAEWTKSKNEGYWVMLLTIKENGVTRFSYCDYGTQCADWLE